MNQKQIEALRIWCSCISQGVMALSDSQGRIVSSDQINEAMRVLNEELSKQPQGKNYE